VSQVQVPFSFIETDGENATADGKDGSEDMGGWEEWISLGWWDNDGRMIYQQEIPKVLILLGH
jgi:hypothetical protein